MTEETLRILHQSDPNDTRFQFEIIKQLAESVREATTGLRSLQETQVRMLERLARIEEQRTHEAVAGVLQRVNVLEQERDRRDGAASYRSAFLSWWGPLSWTLGIAFTVLFLILRATGILHMPAPKETPAVVRHEPIEPVSSRANRETTQ